MLHSCVTVMEVQTTVPPMMEAITTPRITQHIIIIIFFCKALTVVQRSKEGAEENMLEIRHMLYFNEICKISYNQNKMQFGRQVEVNEIWRDCLVLLWRNHKPTFLHFVHNVPNNTQHVHTCNKYDSFSDLKPPRVKYRNHQFLSLSGGLLFWREKQWNYCFITVYILYICMQPTGIWADNGGCSYAKISFKKCPIFLPWFVFLLKSTQWL